MEQVFVAPRRVFTPWERLWVRRGGSSCRGARAGEMFGVPIPVNQPTVPGSLASTPSSSATLPNSQSQTVVVENPMSVDKSGKLFVASLPYSLCKFSTYIKKY
ncbi:zinc finger protein LSD1 [Striga asiatica]|uniref:Zinc finger protein LSD1 n=1 Tax=Striga asiatica TaxID=4170 RepID=A0A5A7PNH3_STRAF|nr:zinc finger protein LSD1 [Striga asiatica]